MSNIVKNPYDEFKNISEMRNFLVVKANNIIQNSKFYLTAQEQNIVLYLISKIKKGDTEFEEITFDISEFCKIAGISDAGSVYKEVMKTIEKLSEKRVWVKVGDNKEQILAWIDTAFIDYNPDVNIVRTKLSDTLKPYILEQKGNFTEYELEYALSLKSKYSKRMYEILRSYLFKTDKIRTVKLGIEQLKEQLFCQNYKTWGDFNRKVLEIAQREINECSDINFTYSVFKYKRKFTEIEFVITEKTESSQFLFAAQKRYERLNGSLSSDK